MPSVLHPDFFQVYCAAAVAFELPVLVQLLRGQWTLPDAGSWFDNELHYQRNQPLVYVFVALLTVLVAGRIMAFVLPNVRLIIAYNIVLHALELVTFCYCFQQKQDPADATAYVILALMLFNVLIFAYRLILLKGKEKQAEMDELKWRQEQLAIIRQKRAAYAQEKELKKTN